MTEATGTTAGHSRNLLLEISNALVGIHKEFYGRGPTKARSYVSDDLVVVVLQGGYSRAEQTLLDHGRAGTVTETRLALQEAIKDTSVTTIERLTGRTVRSCMSANDPEQELQAELFLLEPQEAPTSDRSDLGARAHAALEESAQVREDLRALRAEQVQIRSALQRQGKQRARRAD